MIGDMYTDVERTLFLHLTRQLSVLGLSIPVHTQMFVVPGTGGEEIPVAININKISDVRAHENGGGDQAFLVTKDTKTGQAVKQTWPEGFKLGYEFVVYADTLADVRASETAIQLAFPSHKPVYLYDTTDVDNPILTMAYMDLTHGTYVNRDDSVERRYQRHLQRNFEVFNYNELLKETVPLIQKMEVGVAAVDINELLKY